MIETVTCWIVGLALGGAIAVGIGKPLIVESGQKIIAPVAIAGLLLGAALGWALNTYISYVHASATLHP